MSTGLLHTLSRCWMPPGMARSLPLSGTRRIIGSPLRPSVNTSESVTPHGRWTFPRARPAERSSWLLACRFGPALRPTREARSHSSPSMPGVIAKAGTLIPETLLVRCWRSWPTYTADGETLLRTYTSWTWRRTRRPRLCFLRSLMSLRRPHTSTPRTISATRSWNSTCLRNCFHSGSRTSSAASLAPNVVWTLRYCMVRGRRIGVVLCPSWLFWRSTEKEQAVVVHRYLQDIAAAFGAVRSLMQSGGVLVIVCGDNLIGGRRICTWQVLNKMLAGLGFKQFDSFGDRIRNRAVAPMRCGHKGLIKQEIVSAFRLK